MFTHLKLALGAVLTAVALLGCTPSPTAISANVTGTADMNGGLPAKATIFYLTSTSKFNASDYGSLAANAQAALGADLLGTQDVLLSPGQTKVAGRSFDGEGPSAVGIIVGFKALSTAQWRATTAISSGKLNTLTVSIGSGSVKISK